MNFHLDLNGPVPIYEQVIYQIKFAIATGAIAPGETIPSVRELARELAINPNTVSKAYRDLQKEGVVYYNRGMGLGVAETAPELCRRERINLFEARVARILDEALKSELDPETIRAIVLSKLDALDGAPIER